MVVGVGVSAGASEGCFSSKHEDELLLRFASDVCGGGSLFNVSRASVQVHYGRCRLQIMFSRL